MGKEINNQTAGDNANQVQATNVTMNNYYGITEDRAKQLFDELSKKANSEIYEGIEIANQRIKQFENIVIPKIQNIENDFKSFSDPSFQILLKKAQLTAAISERPDDYDLLTELIIHRINNKEDRKKKTSIEKAVEIIDKIDSDALCGLTIFYAMINFSPLRGYMNEGLEKLNDLYAECKYQHLPSGKDWLDNLDILQVVRINPAMKFKKFKEYLFEKLNGYTCIGIKIDSDEYKDACKELEEVELNYLLIEHELLKGYARLTIPFYNAIDTLVLSKPVLLNNTPIRLDINASDKQKEILRKIFNSYSHDSNLLNQVKKSFYEKLNSYKEIISCMNWWDTFDNHFEITSIGKVIAHANAKRIDKKLPDLD